MTILEMCEKILEQLEKQGWERADLPGPGDLSDAIVEAGFSLREDSE